MSKEIISAIYSRCIKRLGKNSHIDESLGIRINVDVNRLELEENAFLPSINLIFFFQCIISYSPNAYIYKNKTTVEKKREEVEETHSEASKS